MAIQRGCPVLMPGHTEALRQLVDGRRSAIRTRFCRERTPTSDLDVAPTQPQPAASSSTRPAFAWPSMARARSRTSSDPSGQQRDGLARRARMDPHRHRDHRLPRSAAPVPCGSGDSTRRDAPLAVVHAAHAGSPLAHPDGILFWPGQEPGARVRRRLSVYQSPRGTQDILPERRRRLATRRALRRGDGPSLWLRRDPDAHLRGGRPLPARRRRRHRHRRQGDLPLRGQGRLRPGAAARRPPPRRCGPTSSTAWRTDPSRSSCTRCSPCSATTDRRPGRYREFRQFNVEAIGDEDPLVDAEVIAVLWRFLEALGLRDLTIQLNSIGDPVCRPGYIKALVAYYEPHEDRAVRRLPAAARDEPAPHARCKKPACQPLAEGAPRTLDHLCEACASTSRGSRSTWKRWGCRMRSSRGWCAASTTTPAPFSRSYRRASARRRHRRRRALRRPGRANRREAHAGGRVRGRTGPHHPEPARAGLPLPASPRRRTSSRARWATGAKLAAPGMAEDLRRRAWRRSSDGGHAACGPGSPGRCQRRRSAVILGDDELQERQATVKNLRRRAIRRPSRSPIWTTDLATDGTRLDDEQGEQEVAS